MPGATPTGSLAEDYPIIHASARAYYFGSEHHEEVALGGQPFETLPLYHAGSHVFTRGGSDTVSGGSDGIRDWIDTGRGDDTVVIGSFIGSSITGAMTGSGDDVRLGEGNDIATVYAPQGSHYGSRIDGGAGADNISVSYGERHTVSGGQGVDIIQLMQTEHSIALGGEGNDSFDISGNGNIVEAGFGDDTLAIHDGNTIAMGGAGDDLFYLTPYSPSSASATLYGNEGRDFFIFNAPSDLLLFQTANSVQATIADFTHGQDRIDIGAFGTLSFANLHLQAQGDGTLVQFGVPGAASGTDGFYTVGFDVSLLLEHVRPETLSAADFMFY